MAFKNWPPALAYDQALLNRATTFTDPTIKHGILTEDPTGPIRFNGSGKYVCVYQVSDWIVRCFADTAPDDVSERYRAITAFVNSHRATMPFLLEHIWVEQGIYIEGRAVPFLKVPFVQNCQTLGTFLENYCTDKDTYKSANFLIRDIAKQFRAMINQLEKARVAHGDLDITNILVIGSGNTRTLKLIDYDGMYVPTLASRGFKPVDLGHVHFQPPNTMAIRHFGPQMDRFSVLVLYLSLIAIAEEPSIWENCEASDTERLLLNAADYSNFTNSGNYARLMALNRKNPEILKCLAALDMSIKKQQMPDALEQILLAEPVRVHKQAFSRIPIRVDQNGRADPPYDFNPPPEEKEDGPPTEQPPQMPVYRTNKAEPFFNVFTALLLFCGLVCAGTVNGNPGILAASWIFSFLGLISDCISLRLASHKARGWKIFCVIFAVCLLIVNGVLQWHQ